MSENLVGYLTPRSGTILGVLRNVGSGRGIASVDIDENYYLVVTYTDGTTWSSDPVSIKGEQGEPGDVTNIASEFSTGTSYTAGQYVIYNGYLYIFTSDHAAGAWTGTDAGQVTVGSELNDVRDDIDAAVAVLDYEKADQNGVYPDLSAGNITGDFHIDTKPYLYRALRDVASHIGSKAFDTLVGGTVAVNQLVQNGNFETNTGWSLNRVSLEANNNIGICSVVSTNYDFVSIYKTNIPQIVNHKYYWCSSIKVESSNADRIDLYVGSDSKASITPSANNWYTLCSITNPSNTNSTYLDIKWTYAGNTISIGDKAYIKDCMCIDLTQLFASDPSIADRAYTLEQGTAGAGIAWLKSYGYIRDGYIPYNAGTLQSVLTTGKKVVGFNQWDEEWERANVNWSTYTFVPNANGGRLASKNYIPVIDGETYYINKHANVLAVAYIDEASNGPTGITISANGSFTIPNGCHFIKFGFEVTAYGTTYNHDICINLSKTTGTPKNGDYLPYESVSYPLDNVELRGVAKLVGNEIKYDGDICEADGTVTRKRGKIVLDGSVDENWGSYNSAYDGCSVTINDMKVDSANPQSQLITDKIAVSNVRGTSGSGLLIKVFTSTNDYKYLFICGTGATSTEELRTWLSSNPITVEYPLATPTTETVDPFTSPQQVFSDGTEEYIDARTVPIPVGHETKYELDLASKLIGLPWDMSMIAPVEVEYKATRNYTAGQYLIVDNTLYKVTSNISNGGTITPNSNVTETTVATELIALA